MYIIGITGTIGAGKGAVVEYLIQRGFTHFSARELILDEVRRRGFKISRENTTNVANDLRTIHGPSYIIETLFYKAEESGKNCIIESIRAIGELEFLRTQKNFKLFAVDADPELRHKRVLERRSELDRVSLEQFLAEEKREMFSTNPNEGSIIDCIKRADYVFENNGTKEELYKKVEEILKKVTKN